MVDTAWHIELTDGTDTIKANCVDPQGAKQSMRYLERAPLERTSMKLGQGRTQYSDLVPPWYSITQDDFSGGRGGKNLVDDPSKYFDSYGMQPWIPKRLVLGPLVHTDDEWLLTFGDDPETGIELPGTAGRFAQTFTPEITTTVTKFRLWIETADANTLYIIGALLDTNGGAPDATLTAGLSGFITGAQAGWVDVNLFSAVTLEAGTAYAVEFYISATGSGTLDCLGHETTQYTGAAYEWNAGWDLQTTVVDYALQIEIAAGFLSFGDYPVATQAAEIPLRDIGKLGQTFTPDQDIMIKEVQVYVTYTTVVNKQFNLEIKTAVDGDVIAYGVTELFDGTSTGAWITVELDSPQYLYGGNEYAVVMYGTIEDATGTFNLMGHASDLYTGDAYSWTDGGGWVEHVSVEDFAIRFSVTQSVSDVSYFMYRGLLHSVISIGHEGAILSRRGAIGMATSATLNTLTDTGEDYTGWEDRIVKIVAGLGRGQYGTVASVSGDVLTFNENWIVTPDATSLYSSPGPWEVIDVLSMPVWDVLVVDTLVLMATGPDENIQRYKWSALNGDETIVADGTNKAEALALFRDKDHAPCVWRSLQHEISHAAIVDYGDPAMTFSTEIRVGSFDSKITSLIVYDDHLYIGKHDGLFALQEEIVRQVPVDFRALSSIGNCRGMVAWNLYLIFPLLEGLQRLHGTQVDDFGPNTGEGLPDSRQGVISSVLPLPGALIVAIDGGHTKQSSIMLYNNLGWHELARSTWSGQRIFDLLYEVLPDAQIRLYWNEGMTQKYAWMSGRVFDRSRDTRADYAIKGELITGWIGTDLIDVEKIWSKVTTFGDFSLFHPIVSYKLNEESAEWVYADRTLFGDYKTTHDLGDVAAYRIRLKIYMSADYNGDTMVLEAYTVDAVGRVAMADSYQTHFLLENMAISMDNQQELREPVTILAKLDEWSGGATPLTMTNALPEYDSKTVILEPVNVKIAEHNDTVTKRVMAITLIEI